MTVTVNGPSVIPPHGRALEQVERDALLADLKETVASSHLFSSLSEDGLRQLVECGYVMRFAPGQVLMAEGETGSTMYLVMNGTVRVETPGARGAVPLAELSRGACIGEVSVLTGGPRTATVTARDDVQAVAFERHRIHRVLDAHPRVRERLDKMIEGRARDTVEKIIGS